MSSRLPAVILAGGQASRMGGGDKPLLMLDGAPLLTHLLDRLRPQAGPLAINANGDPARFAGFGLPVLPDSVPDLPGPLAGILAGMDWAAELGAPAVISAAGDTPFPPADLAARLHACAPASGLVLAADRDPAGEMRLHPTFGLWPVHLREDLRAALAAGQRRVRQFAEAHAAATALFPSPDQGPEPFFNINRPADLALAARLCRQARQIGDS